VLDETTLTRNLRPLVDRGWVAVREGKDRRERLVSITATGRAKLAQARPAWERAQERLQTSLPKGVWESLMSTLPEVARLTSEA
jgi:DNA-binding MarR family transcriptional regulator